MIDRDLALLETKNEELIVRLQSKPNLRVIDFFPEFAGVVESSLHSNSICWLSPWTQKRETTLAQIPFYDHIIFPISPSRNAEAFKVLHGISCHEIVQLYDQQKRLLPVLMHDPTRYSNLDYLDEVLCLNPPVFSLRLAAYEYQAMSRAAREPQLFKSDLSLIEDRLQSQLLKLNDRELSSFIKMSSVFSPVQIPFSEKPASLNLIDHASFAEYNLGRIGYGSLIQTLHKLPLENRVFATLLYGTILYTIPRLALNGTLSWIDPSLGPSLAKHFAAESLAEMFPVDVAKLLVRKLDLIGVRNIGIDEVLEISDTAREARVALLELEKAVAREQQEAAIDRAAALETVWHSVESEIQSMLSVRGHVASLIQVAFGAAGGIVGSLAGLPTAIAGALGGMVSSLPVAQPIAQGLLVRSS